MLRSLSVVFLLFISSELGNLEICVQQKDNQNNAAAVLDFINNPAEGKLSFVKKFSHPVLLKPLHKLKWGSLILEECADVLIDPYLVWAVIQVESSGNDFVISNKGAVGLMQILPATAKKSTEWLLNPKNNLNFGCRYLQYLSERFNGNLDLILAAYNAGPTRVSRLNRIPNIEETKQFVFKVLSYYRKILSYKWIESGVVERIRAGEMTSKLVIKT